MNDRRLNSFLEAIKKYCSSNRKGTLGNRDLDERKTIILSRMRVSHTANIPVHGKAIGLILHRRNDNRRLLERRINRLEEETERRWRRKHEDSFVHPGVFRCKIVQIEFWNSRHRNCHRFFNQRISVTGNTKLGGSRSKTRRPGIRLDLPFQTARKSMAAKIRGADESR